MKKLLLYCLLLGSLPATATVQLPKIFGDGMVLQRNTAIPVWGWASAGETVTVQLLQQVKTVQAGQDGRWKLLLAAEKAGGPYTFTVKGNNTLVLSDVWIGEVWICSGQSNMEFTVEGGRNAEQEISEAAYPQIRHYKVPLNLSPQPLNDLSAAGSWQPADPAHVQDFTAAGYFFAREIYKTLQVPVGIINTTWGGTDVEAWTSLQALTAAGIFTADGNNMPGTPEWNADMKARKQKLYEKIAALQGGMPDTTKAALWKEPGFNDSQWPVMPIPGLWEESVGNFDGVVWLRKNITLTAAAAGQQALLELGMIDDSDDTYVNGVRVGGLQDRYNVKRAYTIPAGLLKAGENSIVVRVEDIGGGGGIYGSSDRVTLTTGNGAVHSLAGNWHYLVQTIFSGPKNAGGMSPNSYPSLLYNAMIHPLIPFAIKGVTWYQGENNASRAYQYRKAFPALIRDWRQRWQQDNFPFYFVQLASFNAADGNSNSGSAWAELREAQALTLALPNTGMAVTTDIGESNDIHPKNKQEVGRRLAVIALHKTYGKPVSYSGPVYQSVVFNNRQAVLSFTETGGGLMAKAGSAGLQGFEIAGTDQHFYPAKAVIANGKIIVSAAQVARPAAVRYAWADDAGQANLYNKAGLPAAPFRTDRWKEITQQVKYTVQ